MKIELKDGDRVHVDNWVLYRDIHFYADKIGLDYSCKSEKDGLNDYGWQSRYREYPSLVVRYRGAVPRLVGGCGASNITPKEFLKCIGFERKHDSVKGQTLKHYFI